MTFMYSSLTRSIPATLSIGRADLTGITFEDFALFGGGGTNTTWYNTVDAYDSNFTRSLPTGFRESKRILAGTALHNYGLFGGGSLTSSTYSNTFL